jgi:RNase P/RNase MRP subunit p30
MRNCILNLNKNNSKNNKDMMGVFKNKLNKKSNIKIIIITIKSNKNKVHHIMIKKILAFEYIILIISSNFRLSISFYK